MDGWGDLRSVFSYRLFFLLCLLVGHEGLERDGNGYVMYCPCMGKRVQEYVTVITLVTSVTFHLSDSDDTNKGLILYFL